jgi:hypothetical protein
VLIEVCPRLRKLIFERHLTRPDTLDPILPPVTLLKDESHPIAIDAVLFIPSDGMDPHLARAA